MRAPARSVTAAPAERHAPSAGGSVAQKRCPLSRGKAQHKRQDEGAPRHPGHPPCRVPTTLTASRGGFPPRASTPSPPKARSHGAILKNFRQRCQPSKCHRSPRACTVGSRPGPSCRVLSCPHGPRGLALHRPSPEPAGPRMSSISRKDMGHATSCSLGTGRPGTCGPASLFPPLPPLVCAVAF